MRLVDLSHEKTRLEGLAPKVFNISVIVGVTGLLATAALAVASQDGVRRAYHSYMVSFCYFLSLSLGALFFVMVHHLSRAGWSVVLRRIAEAIAANVLVLLFLFVPILLGGMTYLFPWADSGLVAADKILQGKQPYLNIPFFILRFLAYFAIWGWWAYYLLRRSVEQDSSGDPKLTLRMERMSAPGMILFALTVTFAAFDWLMSRDPHWYSTIFGVYYFSGCILGFIALLPTITYALQKAGLLRHAVTAEHYHDIGKFMFAFVVFWAYIAFSQYMLIWYANLPEETIWYARRQTGSWTNLSIFLMVGHFFIPFMALISRYPKRRPGLLVIPAVWILAMHYVDLYWLAMPEYYLQVPTADAARVPFHLLDLTTFLGIGGFYSAFAVHWVRNTALIPERDPRLAESLAFENA